MIKQHKCLSVREPWAELIASGEKTIECRSWQTSYRGPLLIAASLNPRTENSGLAIARLKLVDCRPFTKEDCKPAGMTKSDWEPGLFAWVLENVKRIEPIPVKGKLNIYTIEVEVKVAK